MIAQQAARQTVATYLQGWRDNDKQAWLALFTEDAALIDPVGAPAHVGRAAIAAFWDRVRATGMQMQPQLHRVVVCGDEVLASFTMRSLAGNAGIDVDIVDIFKLSEDGRIRELRAYWDNGCMRPARVDATDVTSDSSSDTT